MFSDDTSNSQTSCSFSQIRARDEKSSGPDLNQRPMDSCYAPLQSTALPTELPEACYSAWPEYGAPRVNALYLLSPGPVRRGLVTRQLHIDSTRGVASLGKLRGLNQLKLLKYHQNPLNFRFFLLVSPPRHARARVAKGSLIRYSLRPKETILFGSSP